MPKLEDGDPYMNTGQITGRKKQGHTHLDSTTRERPGGRLLQKATAGSSWTDLRIFEAAGVTPAQGKKVKADLFRDKDQTQSPEEDQTRCRTILQ